jgi:hypothetical protein
MSIPTVRDRLARDAEEDANYAALSKFANSNGKELPSYKKLEISSIGQDKSGRVIVEGSWPRGVDRSSGHYSASIAINPKTAKAEVNGTWFAGVSGDFTKGALTAADRKTVVKMAHKLVEDGEVAASSQARAALAILVHKK